MPTYRIARLEHNGNWSEHEFRAADDPDAIAYARSVRAAARCELFEDDRWLATFDASPECDDHECREANENNNRTAGQMETEEGYFRRRALEAREQARISASPTARQAHLSMAQHLESLGRAVQAERRRRSFYDVNAARDDAARPASVGDRF